MSFALLPALLAADTFYIAVELPSGETAASRGAGELERPQRPGSVWKIVTASALLLSGFDPATSFACGERECWQKAGHGTLSLPRALALSCNRYFLQAAEKLSTEQYRKAAALMGLDPLLTEGVGEKALGTGGSVLVRPVELLRAVMVIAGYGGTGAPGAQAGPGLPADVLSFLRRCLVEAGRDGSAARSGKAAGKTGTVRFGPGDETQGLFVGWWPASEPAYAAAVMVRPGSGYSDAAPAAGKLFKRLAGGRE